jgi:CMP-N-acetylneuraminic acid synthetase
MSLEAIKDLPKGEYKVEILGIHDRCLSAKEIMENHKKYLDKPKLVSLIPARGGSQRIPRKNIKELCGKPLIAWTIEASLKSKYIDRTIVSTEDKQIKAIALEYGAEVIDRPKQYATDKGKWEINGIVQHFKDTLTQQDYHPDYMAFLHVTSPLRTAKHIDEAFEQMIEKNQLLTASFTPFYHLPHTHLKAIDDKGITRDVWEYQYTNPIDKGLPKLYYFNGAIMIGYYPMFNYYSFTRLPVLGYVMKQEDGIDVDTMFDFKVAEMMLKERGNGKRND